jgi:sortase A
MWNMDKSENTTGSAIGACNGLTRGRTLWMWIERVLLTAGLVLLAVWGTARIESILGERAALKKFAALDASAIAVGQDAGQNVSQNAAEEYGASQGTEPSPNADSPQVDFSLWGKQRIRAYKESLIQNTGAPLAMLRIPKIHLEVPLLDGTDDLTLNHAVGRIAGTARPGQAGNIGIAGHRDGFFRGLKNIRIGDVIELKTPGGTDTYVVGNIRIVTPDDVSVLRPGPSPSITLVTCYPFYYIGSAPQRYIVTAFLSGEKSGSGNLASRPLSQTGSSKRRNNEQPK